MAVLLKDKLEVGPSEYEGTLIRKQSVRAGRFLTDANITDVYRTLGPSLPESVLLLTPETQFCFFILVSIIHSCCFSLLIASVGGCTWKNLRVRATW